MLVDLLRHGEPVGGRRYRGQIDDPLSEPGWAQMWAAVGEAAPWRQIITSPLRRCCAFAEALARRHGLPLLEEPRFKEIGFGSWEGKTREMVEAEAPGSLERFYADPVNSYPEGAEPLPAFCARVIEAWRERVEDAYPQDTLIVAHAGVIRAVAGHVLNIPPSHLYRLQVANAGITRIRVHAGRPPSLEFHGVVRGEE